MPFLLHSFFLLLLVFCSFPPILVWVWLSSNWLSVRSLMQHCWQLGILLLELGVSLGFWSGKLVASHSLNAVWFQLVFYYNCITRNIFCYYLSAHFFSFYLRGWFCLANLLVDWYWRWACIHGSVLVRVFHFRAAGLFLRDEDFDFVKHSASLQ